MDNDKFYARFLDLIHTNHPLLPLSEAIFLAREFKRHSGMHAENTEYIDIQEASRLLYKGGRLVILVQKQIPLLSPMT